MNFGGDPISEDHSIVIDLTSMIDVLFVLVLFFMVTTTFSDVGAIDVNLPASSSKASKIEKKDLSVSLNADGQIFLEENNEKKSVSLEALSGELVRLKQSGADLSLVLRADKKVDHGSVVSILDRAKEAGIEKIAIATVSPVGSASPKLATK